MEYRASASVNLTFVALGADGQEIDIDPETGLPVVTISIEALESSGPFGQKLFFNVFISPSGTSYTLENSAQDVGGRIYDETNGFMDGIQVASFMGSNIANLSPNITNADVIGKRWIGNNLGASSIEGSRVVSSRSGLGKLEIKYKLKYFGHSIMVPTQSISPFPVTVGAYVQG